MDKGTERMDPNEEPILFAGPKQPPFESPHVVGPAARDPQNGAQKYYEYQEMGADDPFMMDSSEEPFSNDYSHGSRDVKNVIQKPPTAVPQQGPTVGSIAGTAPYGTWEANDSRQTMAPS